MHLSNEERKRAGAATAAGQDVEVPTISTRSFKTGSAKIAVTGGFQMTEDMEINAKASYGDGEQTWIQFGVSGAAEPNVLVGYGDGEMGIMGQGKKIATAEAQHCKGEVEVTEPSVSGHYQCTGVTSYDGATHKMAEIAIEIRFTANS